MSSFIVTVDNKHRWVLLDKNQGITQVKIILAEPKKKLDFRTYPQLCLRINVDGTTDTTHSISLSEYVKTKRKKKKTAHIDAQYNNFNTIQIEVYHISNENFPFEVDFVLNVR